MPWILHRWLTTGKNAKHKLLYFSLRFFKRRCTWLREDVWVLAQATHFHNILLSPFHTDVWIILHLQHQKLTETSRFYYILLGQRGFTAWQLGDLVCSPVSQGFGGCQPSLQAPGKAAQAASKTAKCLGMTMNHGHADLVGRTWHDFAPCQFFHGFFGSKIFQILPRHKALVPKHRTLARKLHCWKTTWATWRRWHLESSGPGRYAEKWWKMDVRHDRLCLPSWERSSSSLSRRSLNVADVAGTGWLFDVLGVSWETLACIFQTNLHVADGLHDTASDWFNVRLFWQRREQFDENNVDLRQLRWWMIGILGSQRSSSWLRSWQSRTSWPIHRRNIWRNISWWNSHRGRQVGEFEGNLGGIGRANRQILIAESCREFSSKRNFAIQIIVRERKEPDCPVGLSILWNNQLGMGQKSKALTPKMDGLIRNISICGFISPKIKNLIPPNTIKYPFHPGFHFI